MLPNLQYMNKTGRPHRSIWPKISIIPPLGNPSLKYSIVCVWKNDFFVEVLVDTWGVSTLALLWIAQRWTFLYTPLIKWMIRFLLGVYPGVELLGEKKESGSRFNKHYQNSYSNLSSHLQWVNISVILHPCQYVCCCFFSFKAILGEYKCYVFVWASISLINTAFHAPVSALGYLLWWNIW